MKILTNESDSDLAARLEIARLIRKSGLKLGPQYDPAATERAVDAEITRRGLRETDMAQLRRDADVQQKAMNEMAGIAMRHGETVCGNYALKL